MLHSNVSKNLGFTLIESLLVVSMVGILSAMAIPSFIAAQNQAKLNQATEMVVSSLQQSQQEAIRRNQSCTITLDKTEHKILGQPGCLPSGNLNLPDAINLNYTGASNTIQYGIRGNTTSNKSVILLIKNSPKNSRCLTVSAPLGIIRLGSYDSNTYSCKKLNS